MKLRNWLSRTLARENQESNYKLKFWCDDHDPFDKEIVR